MVKSSKKKRKIMRKRIGVVGVDSGQLLIVDPCYLGEDFPTCEEICDYDLFKQLHYKLGHAGLGVVFSSGFGDGLYEVIATIVDFDHLGTRIVKVEINLIQDVRNMDQKETTDT